MNKPYLISYLILMLIAFCNGNLYSQQAVEMNKHKPKIGVMYGYGDQHLLNLAYDYTTHYFSIPYYYPVRSSPQWNIELMIEPQWNQTKFKPQDQLNVYENGFEVGMSAGFLFRHFIQQNSSGFTISISSGPHYTSGTPDRQREGFLFATSVFVGAFTKVTSRISLQARYGFRHISNANLQQPNGGVNQMIWNVGFMIHKK